MNATHPLANAIVQAAFHASSTFRRLKQHEPTKDGVYADVAGIGRVKVGEPDYCHVQLPDDLGEVWQIPSIVAVSADDVPIGTFALADELKPTAQKR